MRAGFLGATVTEAASLIYAQELERNIEAIQRLYGVKLRVLFIQLLRF